jgi:hypothetical protein
MGRKHSDLSLFWLILFGIVAAPFIFLYNFLGPVGSLLVLLLILVGSIYFVRRHKIKGELSFQQLLLETITTRSSPDKAKADIFPLMRSHPQKAQLLRNFQIIRDSIDISLSSKKRDIAESRMGSVRKLWLEVEDTYSYLLSEYVEKSASTIVNEALFRYQTVFYVNQAQAFIDKISVLKTDKAKAKYREMALQVIQEGLANPESNKADLEALLFQFQHI